MESILTLNCRGHLLFPEMRDLFDLTNSQMRAEILTMQRTTIASLAAKKISYRDLRSGLTPTADRNEAAFIFDSSVVESRAYGHEVMRQVLPLLDPRSTQSVLCGDLLGQNQQLIYKILNESMVLTKSFDFRHSALLFCVYVNNLSDAVLKKMHERLPMFAAYLGYIPTTFASRAKVYLSTTLVNVFLKNGKKIMKMIVPTRRMLTYPAIRLRNMGTKFLACNQRTLTSFFHSKLNGQFFLDMKMTQIYL
jgi:hypothetical protein